VGAGGDEETATSAESQKKKKKKKDVCMRLCVARMCKQFVCVAVLTSMFYE